MFYSPPLSSERRQKVVFEIHELEKDFPWNEVRDLLYENKYLEFLNRKKNSQNKNKYLKFSTRIF